MNELNAQGVPINLALKAMTKKMKNSFGFHLDSQMFTESVVLVA